MFRVIDYIRYFQPDILERLTSLGLCELILRENSLTILYEEEELTPEQRYLDKLMRQRPRWGR